MTTRQPGGEPLPSDIAMLLEGVADESASDAVRERVRARLQESVANTQGVSAEGTITLSGTCALGALGVMGVVLVVGALIRPGQGPPAIEVVPGVTLVENKEAPTARGVRLAATPMKAAPSTPTVTSPLMQAPAQVVDEASQAPVASPAAPSQVREAPPVPRRDLARERALLDKARAALRASETRKALSLVSKHRGRFPHGALVEERESIWIRALVERGSVEKAKKRGARFLRRYPRSIHRAAVERALEREGP